MSRRNVVDYDAADYYDEDEDGEEYEEPGTAGADDSFPDGGARLSHSLSLSWYSLLWTRDHSLLLHTLHHHLTTRHPSSRGTR